MGQLQRVNISRGSLKDLEHGILELEKRGYELIKKDVQEYENKDFHYKGKRFGPQSRFDGWVHTKRYKAVMERIWHG